MATITDWQGTSISKGSGDSVTIPFSVVGPETEALAIADFESNAPANVLGLPRASYTMEWIGQGIWSVQAVYRLQTNPENQKDPADVGQTAGQGQVSLEISGATLLRKQSLGTTAYGIDPPDHHGAIDVDENGDVNGVNVFVPQVSYRETHYFNPASVTQTYRNTVISMTGTVNDDEWKTFEAGEVLFLGATFSLSDGERITATYNFSIEKNAENLSAGGISGIDKDGQDFIWFYHITEKDQNNEPVKILRAVYVEKVYNRTDFSALQIGI